MNDKNYIIIYEDREFGAAGGNFYDDGEHLLYFSKMVMATVYRDSLPPFFDVYEVNKNNYNLVYSKYCNCYISEINNIFLNIKDEVEYLVIEGVEIYYEWVDHDKR